MRALYGMLPLQLAAISYHNGADSAFQNSSTMGS